MSDLLERLREESLRLARNSFDSVDAGISANLCDEAIDEIERLRAARPDKMKPVYLARWRTIVFAPEAIAAELVYAIPGEPRSEAKC